MARHFTQSRRYRDFSLADVRSEEDAFLRLTELRFGHERTFACPLCGAIGDHYLRAARRQWRCRECDGYFSPTSGTAFHKRKVSCLVLLTAIRKFALGHHGVSAAAIAADLGVDPRTAWLLYSKIREAFVTTWDTSPLEGTVQIDGGHFCGKPHRANRRQKPTSKSLSSRLRGRKAAIDPTVRQRDMEPWNAEKFKNRRIALVIRQMGTPPHKGAVRTIVAVVRRESADEVIPYIGTVVAPGSTIMTDSGMAFASLCVDYDHRTVNHSKEYSNLDGVNNNQAESYNSRLRRGEFGVFHAMRPTYFLDYCVEMAWREDYRRQTIGEKVRDIISRTSKARSVSFTGYYQGHRRGTEWMRCPTSTASPDQP